MGENLHLYTTAITAASKIGDYDRALELVDRMKRVGVKPNMMTLTALMQASLKADQADTAITIFSELKKISTPDGRALSMGIRAYCDAGNYRQAAHILSEQKTGKEMSGKDIMYSYNYFLYSSLKSLQYESARQSLTEFLKYGFIPSKATFQLILDGLNIPKKRSSFTKKQENEKESFKFLLFVLDSLEKRKLSINAYFYTTILFDCSLIGGLAKKIGSLMTDAKETTTALNLENRLPSKSNELSWETLYLNWDSKKYRNSDPELPLLRVRTLSKEVRNILASEQSVNPFRNRFSRREKLESNTR